MKELIQKFSTGLYAANPENAQRMAEHCALLEGQRDDAREQGRKDVFYRLDSLGHEWLTEKMVDYFKMTDVDQRLFFQHSETRKKLAAAEKALIELSERYAQDTAELQRQLKGKQDGQEEDQG